MKKYIKRFAVLVLGTALCMQGLSGCGQSEGSGTETEQTVDTAEEFGQEQPQYMTDDNAGTPGAERVPVLEGREPYDLLSQAWCEGEKAAPAPSWWNLTAYRENLLADLPDMANKAKYRAVDGKDYYILAIYDDYSESKDEPQERYYLNHIDGDTLETECHQLYLEELETEHPYGVVSLDVTEGRPVVFVREWDLDSNRIEGYRGIWFDQEGHVESSQDLMPALQQARLLEEDGYLSRDSAKWDSRGYYCVRGSDQSGQYAVIDEQGELAAVLDPAQGLQEPTVYLYHDSRGRCIWEAVSYRDVCNVFWSMDQELQQRKLHESSYQSISGRIVNDYGDLYYVNSNNALVRWDASTGKCENLYLGGGATFREYCEFLQNSSGDIVLFYDDGSRDYLFRIANEDVENVRLTLACYNSFTDYYTNMFVSEFNRLHPGVQIDVQMPDSMDERDNSWSRIQADLVAGHGPDLLMAPRAQLQTLQEKGILTELSQILDRETREQIFPGVLEDGTINGGLYSFSHTATTASLIVSRELWPEDTWTWEEAVGVLEELERAGQPVQSIINDRDTTAISGRYLLLHFFLADLEHCSLLDLEEGKAYFDTEEFCHLLEVCKRYAQSQSAIGASINLNEEMAAARERLKEGEILCYRSLANGEFRWFSEDMADLGEDYHLVGYPTESDSGSFISCYTGIAVNSATEHPELAAEFLNYIASRSCQEKADYPVRRDVFVGRIAERTDYQGSSGRTKVFLRTSQGALEIEGKPDGTSYLPEYLEFMDSCRADSKITEPIEEIISEEVDAFFAGDKDAQSVAGVIQSRVQTYLNENW